MDSEPVALTLVTLALVTHGLLHFVGFVVPWRYASIRQLQPAEAVFGQFRLGNTANRAIGLVWLAASVSFIFAAAALVAGAPGTLEAVVVITVASLALCIYRLPDMLFGALVDIVILAVAVPLVLAGSGAAG